MCTICQYVYKYAVQDLHRKQVHLSSVPRHCVPSEISRAIGHGTETRSSCTPKFSDSFATQSSWTENNFRHYNETLFDAKTIFNDGVFSEKLVQSYVLSFDSAVNNLYVNIYINILTSSLKFNKMYKEHNKMQ